MRTSGVAALLLWLSILSACAPRSAPLPTVDAPRYPEFVAPAIPPELAAERLRNYQERAWTFLQAGDLRNAEREAQAALRASSSFYPAEITSAYVRLAQGDAKGALARFDSALGRAKVAAALVGRGQALAELDRDAEAIASLESALAVEPGLTGTRRQLEVLRFRALERDLSLARAAVQAGRFEEAEKVYTAAIERSPDSAILLRELGDVQRRQGNVDAALEHFRRVVELDPTDASALMQIGGLLEERDDFNGALAAYDQAMALDPSPGVTERRDAVRRRIEISRLPSEYQAIETAAELTRGQLAALIGVRLARVLTPMKEGVLMTDVRNEWAEPWIVAVAQAGVIDPFANHTFQPNLVVRRVDLAQAVVQVLTRVASPSELRSWQTSSRAFSDLSPGHLAHPAALLAVASGVMTAGPDDAFEPSTPVTGAEAVAVIERLESMAGIPGAGSVSRR